MYEYYCATVGTAELNHITYSDLTDQFPVQSYSGHQYILAIYDYDSNSILVELMKNHCDMEMIRAYTTVFN